MHKWVGITAVLAGRRPLAAYDQYKQFRNNTNDLHSDLGILQPVRYFPKLSTVLAGNLKSTTSETLNGSLVENGFEVEHDSNLLNFNYILINTCGFIGDAKEESINTILSYVLNPVSRVKLIRLWCLVACRSVIRPI